MFILRDDGELCFEGKKVSITPCFPAKHMDKFLSVRNDEGEEVHFLSDLSIVTKEESEMIATLLSLKGKKLNILKVYSVEDDIELRVFKVNTSAGETMFYTRLEDWPKKLSKGVFSLIDIHEDEYILDLSILDKKSRQTISGLVG